MPVDVFDDNIYQSANWTRKGDPVRERYQMLGGVSVLKQQNPTYIDQTNTNLTSRAVDRRVANPLPSMNEVMDEDSEGQSSKGQPASVDKEEKPRKHRRRRRSHGCRAEGDDQEIFSVCPPRKNFELTFGEFTSEIAGTCRDLSLAVSKRKQGGSIVDACSKAIYQRKRPLYLGIILLLVLLILIILVSSKNSK